MTRVLCSWWRESASHNGVMVSLLFDPRDLWIGLFWDREEFRWGTEWWAYIGIVPAFPIRLIWKKLHHA